MHVMQNRESTLARLAGRQYVYVTYAQLLGLGFGRGAIAHMCVTGRLIRVYQGVYAVGHVRTDPAAQMTAAILACGPNVVASHSSAAFLWGMTKRWHRPPHVIVPTNRKRPNIHVHKTPHLAPKDTRTHLGIRVTSPARTLLDIAPTSTDKSLARAAREARLNRHLKIPDLRDTLARNPHHPGAAKLRRLAATTTGPTRSEFEDRFGAFARRFNLPPYLVNAPLAGYEVDVLFPAEKVVIELDGYEFHRDRRSFISDREKGAALAAEGHLPIHVTWDRLIGVAAEREAERLHKTLAARRQTS
jgi:very-short-patch-repair endonuclease